MADSDSSGTLSSAGREELLDDDEAFDKIASFPQRDSLLSKQQQTRRLSAASSNLYNHSDIGWNDGLMLGDDNKSVDDSDDGDEQLDAEQLIEQEHEKLQFFTESLSQCQKLSGKMTGVLQNLQDKLRKLQTTLDPIRKDTTQVSTAEKNINRTMSELQKVMEYHFLTTEPLESVRHKALKASSGLVRRDGNGDRDGNGGGGGDKDFDHDEWNDPFLIWIEKINEARNYFEENSFKSSDKAITNLQNIAKIALNRMEDYFRDLLKQHTTRNKRVIDEMAGYRLMSHWKHRNPAHPLWTNKLFTRKNRKYKSRENDDDQETDLLYIPYNVIQLLANVALRIEQTATCHNLPDNLSKLVIAPRSQLLLEILESLDDERLLTILYVHEYFAQAMKNKATNLFNKKKRVRDVKRVHSQDSGDDADADDVDDGDKGSMSLGEVDGEEEDDDDEEEDEEKKMDGTAMAMADKDKDKHKVGVLSADALEQLNTMHALDNDPDADTIAIVNIDIKKISHPIVLLMHIALSLFQLERHLCSTVLDVKNEVLLEFDEFFNELVAGPLALLLRRVDAVIKVKDVMDVTRNAQMSHKSGARRVSMNQMSSLTTNPNMPMDEAAKYTARSTAQAVIANDAIHKNMILVKLDLVATWMRLYPVFDKVLNQSQDYGVSDGNDDDEHERKMGDAVNAAAAAEDVDSKRGMVHLAQMGERLYQNTHEVIEARIAMIKTHKEVKNVRVDGGYHPLTIETVNLMHGIYEHRDALQSVYDAQKSLSPMVKILINESGQDTDLLQRQQIEKTLVAIVSALRHNLKHKSAQYGNNKRTLEAIFMLNNVHYIVKKIADTDLAIACGQDVIKSLTNDLAKWKSNYEKATWDKVREYIDISKLRDDYFTDKTANLTTKDKKPIKSRYSGFNKEFGEQLETQKLFNVPDVNLRTELIKRNIDIVLPMYRMFAGKFQNIQFTKDRGKYHKYEEKVLYEKMHQFFQQQ